MHIVCTGKTMKTFYEIKTREDYKKIFDEISKLGKQVGEVSRVKFII